MRGEEIRRQTACILAAMGHPAEERGGVLRFDLTRSGLRWACALTFQEDYAHLFGLFPYAVDGPKALPALNRLNAALAEGCFLLRKGDVYLRQTLFIPDVFAAARAVEAAVSRHALFMPMAMDELAAALITRVPGGRETGRASLSEPNAPS